MDVWQHNNAIHSDGQGRESLFPAGLGIERDEYIALVKEKWKFMLIHTFTRLKSDTT